LVHGEVGVGVALVTAVSGGIGLLAGSMSSPTSSNSTIMNDDTADSEALDISNSSTMDDDTIDNEDSGFHSDFDLHDTVNLRDNGDNLHRAEHRNRTTEIDAALEWSAIADHDDSLLDWGELNSSRRAVSVSARPDGLDEHEVSLVHEGGQNVQIVEKPNDSTSVPLHP
jgi:hypothetical protein